MVTKAEVLRQMQEARDAALDVLDAVMLKRDLLYLSPALWPQIPTGDGMVDNAAANVATVELLPSILEDALAQRPDEQPESLAQAMVIIQQTGESTERYAKWADSSSLVTLAKDVWSALVELTADLAEELANTIIVVGKRAAAGLGVGGVAAAVVAIGGVLYLVFGRRG